MDGTCKKDSTHTYKTGDEIFMQKKDDGSWIICNNEACFKSQGGFVEEKQGGKGAGRTLDMSLAFMKGFNDLAWKIAVERATELYPKGTSPRSGETEKQYNDSIIRIYSVLVQAFNGK